VRVRPTDAGGDFGDAPLRAVAGAGSVGDLWSDETRVAKPVSGRVGDAGLEPVTSALSCSPRLIIADEPTTALDVTIQAQILRQLKQLRDDTGSAVIMVTHDLGVVADIADRVVVMYGGRIVEEGKLDELFYDPQHPYTWGLLGSIARVDRERPRRLPAIPGTPPSLLDPPQGCHFRPRCPHAFDKCTEVPPLEARVERAPEHRDRCWLSVEEKRDRREVADGQIGLVAEGSVIA
jgi:peptide/nickel transport system ATP-binding protein